MQKNGNANIKKTADADWYMIYFINKDQAILFVVIRPGKEDK